MTGVNLAADGGVARITLDRVDKLNVLSAEMIAALSDPGTAERIKGFKS